MKNLWKSYQNGSHHEVWQYISQLVFLNPGQINDEVLKVVYETMDRVSQNAAVLVEILQKLGFSFYSIDEYSGSYNVRDLEKSPALKIASVAENGKVESSIWSLGRNHFLPLSLQAFYERIEMINLVGCFPEWENKFYISNLDPLFIYSKEETEHYLRYLFQNEEKLSTNQKEYHLILSPDRFFKGGESGGGNYRIEIKQTVNIDGKIENYTEDIFFVSYLRQCFEWMGFPNLRFLKAEYYDSKLHDLLRLRKELIPF